jgi:hypothetical protein
VRKYNILKGDTLRDIATRYYQVYDKQGKLKEKQVQRVVNALRKKNPRIHDPDQLPEGKTIRLPSVLGVSARDPAKINVSWRNIRYLLLWFVPVLLWNVLAFTQPVWGSFISQRLQDLLQELRYTFSFDLFGWDYGLSWLYEPLDQLRLGAAQFSIVWALIVFLLWLYFLSTPERPQIHVRVRYLVLWVAGLIALIAWLRTAINAIVPQAASELDILTNLGPLLIVWSTIVLLLYVYLGDGSDAHHAYLGQYQSIWTCLLFVILVLLLANFSAYQDIQERVDGLLAARTLASETVSELRRVADATEKMASDLAGDIDGFEKYVQFYETPPAQPSSGEDGRQSDVEEQQGDADERLREARESLLSHLTSYVPNLKQDTVGMHTKAQAALTQINIAIENDQKEETDQQEPLTGTSLAQTRQVISQTVKLTDELSTAANAAAAEIEALKMDTERPTTTLETILRRDLVVVADEAGDQARVASRTILAVDVAVLATFLWVGGIYAVFVLFPWMLLLLFLFRKRDDRAAQIYDDLQLLDRDENLLHRILPSEQGRQRKPVATIINELALQAFSNFEYIISLLLLSLITAIAWYYVFYPKTSLGLAVLIQSGGEIKELTGYLADNIRPITSGFIGAYFYLMQMLYRRYRDNDLYPMAFLQASERLLRVFILSLVLSIFASLVKGLSGSMAVVAFLAGIYPRAGLRRLTLFVNSNTRFRFPETTEAAPLTELDGLNIWHEARLLDEGVENVEGMADAPIERLVLKTHFPTSQLVDWVDQATLYKHAGHYGEWFPMFRATGIRTATDLLDRAGLSLLKPSDLQKLREDTFRPDSRSLERVIASVNAAQAWEVTTQEGPRGTARATAATLLQAAVSAADCASQVYTLAQTIEKGKRETYDYVFALNQKVVAALKATQEAYASGAPITGAGDPWPGDDDQKARATHAVAKIKQRLDKLVPLAEQVAQLTQPMTSKPETLAQLDAVKKQTDDWVVELTATGTQVQVLIDLATMATQVEETKAATTLLVEKATGARDALTTAREVAREARDAAQSLDAEHPETLDAFQRLKADLAHLQDTAGKLAEDQAKVDKATQAITMNDHQKAAVTVSLKQAAGVVSKLKKAAAQARDATQPLTATDASTLEGLGQSQVAIQQANELYQEARSTVEAAVVAVQAASALPQLTAEILESIVDCLWPDSNMPYVVNYYYQTGQRLNVPETGRQTRKKRR